MIHCTLYYRSKDNKVIPSTKKFDTSYDNMVASLTLREVTEKDTGTYKCEASNDLGSVSTSGQLEVQGKADNFQSQIGNRTNKNRTKSPMTKPPQ
jgi:hypothetical protein